MIYVLEKKEYGRRDARRKGTKEGKKEETNE